MRTGTTRRGFLGGAAALGAGLLVARDAKGTVRATGRVRGRVDDTRAPATRPTPSTQGDADIAARVAALIALSTDARGRAHIAHAAFIDGDRRARGTLAVSASESDALLAALAQRDFRAMQERGVHLGGRKFVFIRESDDGTVIHAVRSDEFAGSLAPGSEADPSRGLREREFVTVRAAPDVVVIATSSGTMVHGRAVEAVFQLLRRTTVVARDAGRDA